MTGLRVNFSDVEAGGFDAVPSGTYVLAVTDAELKEAGENAKHPGSQYISWEFTIQGGDHDNQKLWTNTIVDHGECNCPNGDTFMKGLFALKGLYKATGKFTEEDLKSAEFEIDPDDIIGQTVKARVLRKGSEEDEYGIQNQIKKFMALSDADVSALTNLP